MNSFSSFFFLEFNIALFYKTSPKQKNDGFWYGIQYEILKAMLHVYKLPIYPVGINDCHIETNGFWFQMELDAKVRERMRVK